MSQLVTQPEPGVEDILAAMRQDGGYFDASPEDVLALYRIAYAHAAARLAADVPARAIMSAPVVTARNTALDAARILAHAGVSGLPVLAGDTVVGVLSIKDLLRLAQLPAAASPAALLVRILDPESCGSLRSPSAGSLPVSALMSRPALTIAPELPRSEAAALMSAHQVNRLPVVADGKLLGIVTRGDVARSCRGALGGKRA